jgi:hypothetical protein
MNEIKIAFFGLIALFITAILFWLLDEPEIIQDKEIEIIIGLGIGLLILILDRRADRQLHEKIHQQHELIERMHKTLHEQHEMIKKMHKISSNRNDSSIK